tara:strand:- start:353 stop:679 length:327 start_codon:yes stop_codon:yes gene_type:complete
MIKKLLYFFCLILLSNCTATGSAFLGPAFTGARTGSIYQSSLSFGSGKVLNNIKFNKMINQLPNQEDLKKTNPILPDIPYVNEDPIILISYKVDIIEFSEILEPEPLP